MEKAKGVDDVLKALGIDTTNKATVKYSMWQPWNRDDKVHADDPQGFKGMYTGYKVAEKEQGDGETNAFDIFMFDKCDPKPADGSTGWAVSSGFMLEELKKVQAGTLIAIVYEASEKNRHGGQTRKIQWFFCNPIDREKRVSSIPLPPSNAASMAMESRRALAANGHNPDEGTTPIY